MTQFTAALNLKDTLTVTGTFTTAVILDMGKIRTNPTITSAGLWLISNDSVVAPAAGDDVTIMGSIDGVHYFNIGASNAEVVYGLDDNGITSVTGMVRYLKFTAAQVQVTEYYKFTVVVPQNNGAA